MSVNAIKRELIFPIFNINEYAITNHYKFGRFGHYHFCSSKKETKYYLIKALKKSVIIEKDLLEKILTELKLYEKLRNAQFFPRLLGISTNDPKFLVLYFKYPTGGRLRNLLNQKKKLPLEMTRFYVANILLILDELHKNKIIYRDLKTDSLFIKENGYLTVMDIFYAKELKKHSDKAYTLCGTPNYLAPEIILNKGYNYSVDFWSLGIIFFELLIGKDPFHNKDPIIIYQNILTNNKKFPKIIDRDAKILINHLLVADPEKRYGCLKNGVGDIKYHRFYNDFKWDNLWQGSIEAPFVPEIEEGESITKYFDQEKCNVKLKEKYLKKKEENDRIKKELIENKNTKNNKKASLIEGAEIIDSDTEAKEIFESEDPFINW